MIQFAYEPRVESGQIPFDHLHLENPLNLYDYTNESSEPGPSHTNISSISQTIKTNLDVIKNVFLDKVWNLINKRSYAPDSVACSANGIFSRPQLNQLFRI